MELVKLTHANNRTTVYVAKNQYFCHYYSAGNKCCHVVAVGGAVFPALESEEEIARRFFGTLNTEDERKDDGTKQG